jgi:predicted amidophosphoribosyltransferase
MICPACQKPVAILSNGLCRSCTARKSYQPNHNYTKSKPYSYYEEAKEKAKKHWSYLN